MRTIINGGSLEFSGNSTSFSYKGQNYTLFFKYNRYSATRYVEVYGNNGQIKTIINQSLFFNDNLLFNVVNGVTLSYNSDTNQYILDQDSL